MYKLLHTNVGNEATLNFIKTTKIATRRWMQQRIEEEEDEEEEEETRD
jgi:hypothetical protein